MESINTVSTTLIKYIGVFPKISYRGVNKSIALNVYERFYNLTK